MLISLSKCKYTNSETCIVFPSTHQSVKICCLTPSPTAVGAWFGGVGAAPGAAIGGAIGGLGGGAAGWYAGVKTYEAVLPPPPPPTTFSTPL